MMRLMQDIKVHCPYNVPSAAGIQANPLLDIARPLKKARTGHEADAEETVAVEGKTSEEECKPCSWTGSYGDLLVKHLQECPFHWVSCPRGCGEEHRRCDAMAHESSCSKFFETCKYCGEGVRPEDMAEHKRQAAELHVQILEEKLAAKASKDEAAVALTNGFEKLDRSVEKVAKTQHVTSLLKQRNEDLKQNITEATGEIKQEMWDCMRTGVVWVIKDWSTMLRRFRKGAHMTSKQFNLKGFDGLEMHFYPNGDNYGTAPTPLGHCCLHLHNAGEDELMKFDVTVGTFQGKMVKPPGQDHAYVEPRTPDGQMSDDRLIITVALSEYYESV